MKMNTLDDLLADMVKDLYSAETQITKALPKLAKTASSDELRMAFEEHLSQTHKQIERLDKIGQQLEVRLKGKKCVGMEGIIEEGKEVLEAEGEPEVIDLALIAAAQKVEHYEVASYSAAIDLAQLIGHEDVAGMLQETLDEEQQTSERLDQLVDTLTASGGVGVADEPDAEDDVIAGEADETEEGVTGAMTAAKGRGGRR